MPYKRIDSLFLIDFGRQLLSYDTMKPTVLALFLHICKALSITGERKKRLMTGGSQETREQEVARVQSYLASQSMRRTIPQLAEAVLSAHQQFLAAVDAIPQALLHTAPDEGSWSTMDVLFHMHTIATRELQALNSVLVNGVKPAPIEDVLTSAPREMACEDLLADLEDLRAQMLALALSASPSAHLDLTWSHSEFGAMHWREWLLFARVHILDHARQIRTIATTLAQEKGTDV
jgi:hypothetical protein